MMTGSRPGNALFLKMVREMGGSGTLPDVDARRHRDADELASTSASSAAGPPGWRPRAVARAARRARASRLSTSRASRAARCWPSRAAARGRARWPTRPAPPARQLVPNATAIAYYPEDAGADGRPGVLAVATPEGPGARHAPGARSTRRAAYDQNLPFADNDRPGVIAARALRPAGVPLGRPARRAEGAGRDPGQRPDGARRSPRRWPPPASRSNASTSPGGRPSRRWAASACAASRSRPRRVNPGKPTSRRPSRRSDRGGGASRAGIRAAPPARRARRLRRRPRRVRGRRRRGPRDHGRGRVRVRRRHRLRGHRRGRARGGRRRARARRHARRLRRPASRSRPRCSGARAAPRPRRHAATTPRPREPRRQPPPRPIQPPPFAGGAPATRREHAPTRAPPPAARSSTPPGAPCATSTTTRRWAAWTGTRCAPSTSRSRSARPRTPPSIASLNQMIGELGQSHMVIVGPGADEDDDAGDRRQATPPPGTGAIGDPGLTVRVIDGRPTDHARARRLLGRARRPRSRASWSRRSRGDR